jgi:hypothetical protein
MGRGISQMDPKPLHQAAGWLFKKTKILFEPLYTEDMRVSFVVS